MSTVVRPVPVLPARTPGRCLRRAWRTLLAWVLFAIAWSTIADERHSDPDGCFSCHGLPGLEYIDRDGVVRTATILQKDYYGSLHGSVPCKDCHRKIERYPHKPEEGYVDCSESCHVNEPSKGKAFTHKDVVEEFRKSAHGSGHAPGDTKDFRGDNRLQEEVDDQNPSCRRCHSNTPYIKEAHLDRFKQEFNHADTECGVCHQGETWRNQFSGHILRRLVGNNFNKMEANAMCVDCHGNRERMEKVKIEDPKTKEKKPVDFRFVHATDSYAKTLHGRFLAVNDESGAACIDCHAPKGFRHGIQRDEVAASPTHPDHLGETCGQSGCHGYARHFLNAGFTHTDVHDMDMLRLESLGFALDPERWKSSWYRAAWILVPLSVFFLLASLVWQFIGSRKFADAAILGHEQFQRIIIGSKPNRKGRQTRWQKLKAGIAALLLGRPVEPIPPPRAPRVAPPPPPPSPTPAARETKPDQEQA